MIYLDNAANAPVFPEVLDAMLPWLRPDHVGNPGSIHTQGKRAARSYNKAREQVAHMIGADQQRFILRQVARNLIMPG